MYKKIISIALALIMALSLLTIAASASGGDAPAPWAVPEVDKAKDLGLVPPTLQSKYSDATTRAEFCLLAVTLYEKVTGTTITGRVKFTDTTDVNIEKAAFIGVVNGVGNDRFDPNAALTREQAATMLARLAASVSKPLDKKAATFVDKGSVSTWAIEAVGQCEAAEIMGGTGNNKFSPGGAYQRQQSIATITRMYDYLDGKGTPNHAMEATTTTAEKPTITTPSVGDNAVFANALVGSWSRVGYNANRLPIWVFGTDGRFAYFVAKSERADLGSGYLPSHYESWTQGKYRVNGQVIELYDCMESSYFEYTTAQSDSWRYGFNAAGAPENIPANELLNGSPPEPLKIDNFTATFEFINDERLHLIFDYKLDSYDADFNYMSGSRNINVPTHTLPGFAWPKDSLPSVVPEYSDGRIRYLSNKIDDFNGKWYVTMVIDRTTCGDVWNYTQQLMANGWSWFAYSFDDADDVEEWLLRGYEVRLHDEDNKCEMNISINLDDCFVFACYEW